jgi:hypothetical protein
LVKQKQQPGRVAAEILFTNLEAYKPMACMQRKAMLLVFSLRRHYPDQVPRVLSQAFYSHP